MARMLDNIFPLIHVTLPVVSYDIRAGSKYS
jgi:hypothetical protein